MADRKDQQRKSYSGLNLRENARSRPMAAAAVATAAAAAGAYFLSRRSRGDSGPLMKWGQQADGGNEGPSAIGNSSTQPASGTSSASIGDAPTGSGGSSTTSSSGGGRGSSRSSKSSSSMTPTSASTGNTGLDETSQSDTKAGSISYGA